MEQEALDEIKRTVARNTLLAYPDFNKCFDIHTDTSYHQLVSVIIQEAKSITFYIRKFTETQKRYGNGKGIAEHSQNLKVILHDFIRSTIKNIYRP